MTDDVIEPERCEHCGGWLPIPVDGRWRFMRGGKTFRTPERCQARCEELRLANHGRVEFRPVVDDRGKLRIASRWAAHPA